jgi:hypothetical protein
MKKKHKSRTWWQAHLLWIVTDNPTPPFPNTRFAQPLNSEKLNYPPSLEYYFLKLKHEWMNDSQQTKAA